MTDPVRISLSTNHSGETETRYEFGPGGSECEQGTKDCYPYEFDTYSDHAMVRGDKVEIWENGAVIWSGDKKDVAVFNTQDAKDITAGIYTLEHPQPALARVQTGAPRNGAGEPRAQVCDGGRLAH